MPSRCGITSEWRPSSPPERLGRGYMELQRTVPEPLSLWSTRSTEGFGLILKQEEEGEAREKAKQRRLCGRCSCKPESQGLSLRRGRLQLRRAVPQGRGMAVGGKGIYSFQIKTTENKHCSGNCG